MTIFLPCSVCNLHVRGNAKAVCCDICDNWVHIGCNNISNLKYAELSEPDNDESFVCLSCMNSALPFGKENDQTFTQTNTLGFNRNSHIDDPTFKLSNLKKGLQISKYCSWQQQITRCKNVIKCAGNKCFVKFEKKIHSNFVWNKFDFNSV